MLKTQRDYIYQNKDVFDLEYTKEEGLPKIVIDIGKTYQTNKKRIEKELGKKIQSGVWVIRDCEDSIKRGSDITTYEVAQTYNISKEMAKDLQFLYLGKRDSRKDIYKNFKREVYRRYKYQQIYLLSKKKTKRGSSCCVVFEQIISEKDRQKRLSDEIKIAIEREALFWSPDPTQNKFIWELLKKNKRSFD